MLRILRMIGRFDAQLREVGPKILLFQGFRNSPTRVPRRRGICKFVPPFKTLSIRKGQTMRPTT